MIRTFPRMTTMGAAFLNSKVPVDAIKKHSRNRPTWLVPRCLALLERGGHIIRVREWNASLSYGTAMALKKQGVLVG